MGGTIPHPTYQQVCEKKTGHAETVEVVYDTRKLATRELVREFFLLHDFTEDRRSEGGQYRSAVFFDLSPGQAKEQERVAREMMFKLKQNGFPPVTELHPHEPFYAADSRHQQFCSARGIAPKKRDSDQIREILTF